MEKYAKKCAAIVLAVVMMAASAAVTYAAVHPVLDDPRMPEVPFEVRYVLEVIGHNVINLATPSDTVEYRLFSNEPISVEITPVRHWLNTVNGADFAASPLVRTDERGILSRTVYDHEGNPFPMYFYEVVYTFPAGTVMMRVLIDAEPGSTAWYNLVGQGRYSTLTRGVFPSFETAIVDITGGQADSPNVVLRSEWGVVTNEGGQWSYIPEGARQVLLAIQTDAADVAPVPIPPWVLDNASDWAREAINTANSHGLIFPSIVGDMWSGTAFNQPATRAHFAGFGVALYEAATGNVITERMAFNDTRNRHVEQMGALGIVTGVGGGYFAPNQQLTREQAAVMLVRLANAIGQPLPPSAPAFADNAQISDWAFDAVGAVQAAGIMGGIGDNQFSPQGNFTNEQSIITMLRLFDSLN